MKRNGKIARRVFAAALGIALTFSLTACMDLGYFETEEGYKAFYDSIGDIEAIYDGGVHSYDLKDSLFNTYTVENLAWEDDDDKVAYEEYVYIVVPFKKDLTIESVALFMASDEKDELEVSAFYFPNGFEPNEIKFKSSPDMKIIKVTENGVEVEKEVPIEYDDPLKTERAAGEFCYVSSEWGSFLMEGFSQPGYTDGFLHVEEGGSLYLRIENNSGLEKNTQSCKFSFINLMIRAV